MDNFDLVIVGAGPAGLYLAKELAGTNFKILVLDRKKNAEDVQYNTSGSFINPKEWNLPSNIFYPINRVYFSSKNRETTKRGTAYLINRKKLLSFLEREAKANPDFKIEYNSLVKKIDFNKKGISSISYSNDKRSKKVSAKIFADCSGLGIALGGKLKIAPRKPLFCLGFEYLVPLKKGLHTIDLFVGSDFKGGYGWILPTSRKTAIVGYGTLLKEDFKSIEKHLRDMWKIERVKKRCESKPLERNIGILRTGEPLKKLRKNNLLIIGDSALQANPLIGEGIRFVMDSAKIASKYVEKSLKENNLKHLNDYEKEWTRKYYKKYKLASLIQEKLKKYSVDDKKMDIGARGLRKISDQDFMKLISGDLSRSFIFKISRRMLN